ncbi:MAG: ABC transporter ATP-binding protein [Burkholderiaceae bacterium]
MADLERTSGSELAGVPVLACHNLVKTYRGHRALNAVRFEVRAGESVALLGPNGAGKTSLLKIVLDFSRADSGEVNLFGIDSRLPRARAQLAFLPERFSPNPEMTGAEVITLFGRLRGQNYAQAARTAVLERLAFPLEAVARPVRGYSKGMLQKLGLAIVVLADAPLTVLDEPMSGLDPVARITMRDVLRDLRSGGRTLLFTTHALHDLDLLCDRVLILNRGDLIFDGAPDELRARHQEQDLESAFMACLHAHEGVAV